MIPAAAMLSLPLVGLAILLAQPDLDVWWEHHPAHFWLVLAVGGLSAVLAHGTGVAAERRADARVFLVSLVFLCTAGFLGLHALATPGVLLETTNAGFAVATPVGLALGAVLAVVSSIDLSGDRRVRVMRRARLLRWSMIAVLLAWAAVSLAQLPPLEAPRAPERASGPLLVVAIPAIALYGLAAGRYLLMFWQRRGTMLPGMAAAFVLLGEAMVAVAFARNWHASWWEWHLLMLAAFALVAWSAHRQWHEERFSDLYQDDTRSGRRDMSVLFADLQGFTSWSERHRADEVAAMLNVYFDVAVPVTVAPARRRGGLDHRGRGDGDVQPPRRPTGPCAARSGRCAGPAGGDGAGLLGASGLAALPGRRQQWRGVGQRARRRWRSYAHRHRGRGQRRVPAGGPGTCRRGGDQRRDRRPTARRPHRAARAGLAQGQGRAVGGAPAGGSGGLPPPRLTALRPVRGHGRRPGPTDVSSCAHGQAHPVHG
ncbi:MAG: hypothetical protein M3Q87_06515 [Actinomycetota bacterium]|nr:hypothetical protein [Actinomycetota bacterium]